MSRGPVEVNENSSLADIQEAIRINADNLHVAKITESVAEEDGRKAYSQSQAENNAEATVAGEALMGVADSTSVGAVASIVKTGMDMISDSDPGKFAGMRTMENFTQPVEASSKVAKDIMGDKVRCIKSPFVDDIFARAATAAESVNGIDKPTGVAADEKAASAINVQQISMAQNELALNALGHAKRAEANVTRGMGVAHRAGAPIGPGGQVQPMKVAGMDKDMKIKGPTHMSDEETGSVST